MSNFNQSVGGITRIGEQADVRSNFGTEQSFGQATKAKNQKLNQVVDDEKPKDLLTTGVKELPQPDDTLSKSLKKKEMLKEQTNLKQRAYNQSEQKPQ